MRKAAPDPAEFAKRVRLVRESSTDEQRPNPAFWAAMLELIYTGHPQLAWRFANKAWPFQPAARTSFLNEFCVQLASSPFYQQLRPTLTDAPCTLPAAQPPQI